jgi:hypothetical protein
MSGWVVYVPTIAFQGAFQATAEKVVTLEDERDGVPSVDSIKQELDGVKQEINHNKEEIRECRVREWDSFVVSFIGLML